MTSNIECDSVLAATLHGLAADNIPTCMSACLCKHTHTHTHTHTFSCTNSNWYNLIFKQITLDCFTSFGLRRNSKFVLFLSGYLPLFGNVFSCQEKEQSGVMRLSALQSPGKATSKNYKTKAHLSLPL